MEQEPSALLDNLDLSEICIRASDMTDPIDLKFRPPRDNERAGGNHSFPALIQRISTPELPEIRVQLLTGCLLGKNQRQARPRRERYLSDLYGENGAAGED